MVKILANIILVYMYTSWVGWVRICEAQIM